MIRISNDLTSPKAFTCDTYSYVTIVSTNEYLIGAIALNESLRRVNSEYPLTVVLSVNVDENYENFLHSYGIKYIRLTKCIKLPTSNKNPEYFHWNNTFDKLFIFELTQFKKIVFLDSDMMVVNNIDHLFQKEHTSAVISDRINDESCTEFNSGLMVIVPENGILIKMTNIIDLVASKLDNFGDQDIIRLFFSNWKENKGLELDLGYNVYFPDVDVLFDRGYSLRGPQRIYIIHFVGTKKPWMFSPGKILRTFKRYNTILFLKYLNIICLIKVKLFFQKLFRYA